MAAGSGLLGALVTLAGPVVGRVLLSLGFSVITVTGVAVAVGALKSRMLESLGALPLATLQLLGLGGVWVGLGIMLGAMTFCVSYWTLTSSVRILGKAGA